MKFKILFSIKTKKKKDLCTILLLFFAPITPSLGLEAREEKTAVSDKNSTRKEDEKVYELSREEIDQIEKESEAEFKNGVELADLNQKALHAVADRKIDKCLGILKYKEFALGKAVEQTCKYWLQKHQGDNEKKYLQSWVEGLSKKYPDEIYPFYLAAVNNLFEKNDARAYAHIDNVLSIAEKNKNLNKRSSYQNSLDGFLLFRLGQLLLFRGETVKLLALFDMSVAYLDEDIAKKGLDKLLEPIKYALIKENEKLFSILQKDSIDDDTFLFLAAILLTEKPQAVLELTTKRRGKLQKDSQKVKAAKLFWRAGQIEKYDEIIKPLLRRSNQEAFLLNEQVRDIKRGLPKQINSEAIVRIKGQFGYATGFFYKQNNKVITAAHNFSEIANDPFKVKLFNSKNEEITPIKILFSEQHDLAVIEVKEGSNEVLDGNLDSKIIGEKATTIGYAFGSTDVVSVQRSIIAILPEASDILLSGASLEGASGGPLVYSNQVIGINTTALQCLKIQIANEYLKKVSELKEGTSNLSGINIKNYTFFRPEAIWSRISEFDENDYSSLVPEIYDSPRTVNRYVQKLKKGLLDESLENKTSTLGILAEKYLSSQKPDDLKMLEQQNILKEYFEYIKTRIIYKNREDRLEELIAAHPQFSPALETLAHRYFLASFGKLEEFEKALQDNKLELWEINFGKPINPEALKKSLALMKRYWEIEPNLRWDHVFRKYPGVDTTMRMYPRLWKQGSILLAQEDGDLSTDELKKLAEENNSLAMALLAERLSEGDDRMAGYMYALKSAEYGESKGQATLAFYLLAGNVAAKNEQKGFEWALKSAENGDPRGSTIAGICLVQGLGTPKNTNQGMALIHAGAKGGDSFAQQIIQNPGMEYRVKF